MRKTFKVTGVCDKTSSLSRAGHDTKKCRSFDALFYQRGKLFQDVPKINGD